MKNLLLGENWDGKLYYEDTPVKAQAIALLKESIAHLENPDDNCPPAFTNDLDAYDVILDVLNCNAY